MSVVHRWCCCLIILAFAASWLSAGETLRSPDGRVVVEVALHAEQPRWSVHFRERPVITDSALGLEIARVAPTGHVLLGSSRAQGDSTWKPVWGPLREIRDRYHELTLHLRTSDGLLIDVILRAYDEGVALRYRVPAQDGRTTVTISRRLSGYRFAADHLIHQCRDYSYGTTRISTMKRSEGAVTIDLGDGRFAALTDADRRDFPVVSWRRQPGDLPILLGDLHSPADGTLPFATSWEVLLLGDGPVGLHRSRHLVSNLNPPCAIADTTWIKPGNAICQVRNARMVTDELKTVLDFASRNNLPYLEIDHSWSGAETRWTPAEIDFFAANHSPFWQDKPEWRQNVGGGLSASATGWVPFRPKADSGGNYVDLDVPALCAYGASLNPPVGVCLYVRCILLREFGGDHLMDEVFTTYARWGVAGIKPGFVPAGSQRDERTITQMVAGAAKHRLIAVIHDAYLPSGLSRTYPNLVNSEGVAGEEAEPSIAQPLKSLHDVMLPFTRGLMGPFDYTPEFYKKSKTHCHQVAMIGVYDGRSSLRGGRRAWSPGGVGGEEIAFIRRYPGLFDQEHVVTDLGRQVTIARRDGRSWFVATLGGPQAVTADLTLDFLTPGVRYRASIHHDVPGALHSATDTRIVAADTTLPLRLEADGGQVMIIDPLE